MKMKGTEAKGRPRTRWMDNIRHDTDECGLEEGEAQTGEDEGCSNSAGYYSCMNKGEKELEGFKSWLNKAE